MPLISTFYGILIYMYWLDTKHHHLPHIHARYGEFEAVFAIDSGDCLDGELPLRVRIGNARATRLVFRGQAVGLEAFTRDNVARVELK